MTAHPALARLLQRLADSGGRIEYGEALQPLPGPVLQEAIRAGLVRIGGGSAFGAVEVVTLTDKGREAAGMPPLFSLAGWVKTNVLRLR